MVETVKLFYNSNIAKGSSETRISFYVNIGFFIELAQMLEYNLRKLLCFKLSVKEIEDGDITKEKIEEICKKYDFFIVERIMKN